VTAKQVAALRKRVHDALCAHFDELTPDWSAQTFQEIWYVRMRLKILDNGVGVEVAVVMSDPRQRK
jgi:hypothetical protein